MLASALSDIKNFSVLVLLFVVISALLGMEFFAYRAINEDGSYPRLNFNTFFDAVISVFILLTNEEWNTIMYSHMKTAGVFSSIYFVLIVIIGNYILLKLFLAILINNF